MEPITHFLTGACLGRAGLNRKTALATATTTLAAEAPDLDIAGNFKDPVFGFAHHRGFTHSFLGGFLVAGVVVGFIYLLWLARGRKVKNPDLPPRWGLLFGFAYLAVLSHILLDLTNNYGVRPFWPFLEKWYSWDIVFIAEPLILLFLIAGLVLPSLFRLIHEEIGMRRKGPQGRLAAVLALAGVVGLWGVRDFEHRRAVGALEARQYEGADPLRVSAYPYWVNPFRWHGVVETETFLATMPVDSATGDVDPRGEMRVRYKPPETPALKAAENSDLGRAFFDWAKYPITETEQMEDGGYVVRLFDLRFGYPERATNPLGGRVVLDKDLKVLSESMGLRAPRKP